jgi:dsRNA-specific ribonuclease
MINYNFFTKNTISLLGGLKKSQVSILYLHPEENHVELEYLLTDHLKNIVYVSSKYGKQKISPKEWEKNQEFYKQKTKNAFVLYNKFKGSLADFEEMKRSFRDIYPLVYVVYEDSDNINFEDGDGWNVVEEEGEENGILLVNKKIKKFQNLTFEDFDLKKSVSLRSSKKLDPALDDDIIDISFGETETVTDIKPVTKQKSNEEDFSIFKDLPKPTMRPNHKSKEWLKEFYNYLRVLILRILPPDKVKLIDYILNKETIANVWLKVFTHKVANPTRGENYEIYESIGDRVLKYVFALYFHDRFPLASEGEIANASKHFQSDDRQSETGKHMGLLNWIDAPPELSTNLKNNEDMYEAFAGGLELILNKNTVMGNSTQIIYHFFALLYDEFDFGDIRIDPRTWLGQLIEGIAKKSFVVKKEKLFYLPRPKEIPDDVFEKIVESGNEIVSSKGLDYILTSKNQNDKKNPGFEFITSVTQNNQTEFKVILNSYGAEVLNSYGFNLKNGKEIGKAVEPTTKPAERNGSENAREFLNSIGVTDDWVQQQRRKRRFMRIVNYEEALVKAKSMHKDIIDLDVVNALTIKRDSFFQLIGLTKTHKKYLLWTKTTSNKLQNNFQETIDEFIRD